MTKAVAEIQLELSVKHSVETLIKAAERMEHAAADLRRIASDIQAPPTNHATRADRMGWAINTVVNLIPNLRLDMFASRAAELAVATDQLKAK